MNPPQEPQGWGSRRRIMAYIPDQNVTLMESYVNPTSKVPGVGREQQIWTYRYTDKPDETGGVSNLRFTTTETGGRLSGTLRLTKMSGPFDKSNGLNCGLCRRQTQLHEVQRTGALRRKTV